MTSWRDPTSPEAQADMDGLLEPTLGFAQQQLEKHREFFPFAVVVDRTGEQRMVAAGTGTERPESSDVIRLLTTGLVDQRSELRAAAVVADVRLPELGSDAIRVTIEHAAGIGLEILVPYRIRQFRRAVEYDDMLVSEADRSIWSNG
jgi:hypothetical protein